MATQTTNYGLEKPAWDDMADVSVLNNNSDIIDAQMKANETSAANAVANMADAYDATATYAEGDYCTYGGKLYQANTDISVAEAFDATHWDETTAAEHFSDGGGGGSGTLIQPVIYSDTEREVGVWRDGKPLYQKTIYVDDIGTGNPTEISLAGLDIDTAIDIQAQVTYASNTGKWHLLPYIEPGSPNSSIGLRIELNTTPQRLYLIPGSDYASGSQWYMNHFLATIQYTKTTDTAGSGTWTPSGVPAVHYSEDEQIIGTWIDGKTLYQKTIDFGALPSATSKSVAHGITNLDRVVYGISIAKNNNNVTLILPYVNSGSDRVGTYVDNNNVNIETNTNVSTYTDTYVTIQYTKTTS